MKRTASAIWNGTVKEGNGHLTTKSTALNNVAYSWNSRFEEGAGTNPEELIAAAHAGCFSMAFSSEIGKAGFVPESIETSVTITLTPENLTITSSHLEVKAKVPGASKEVVEKCAEDAKANCPVSKVLNLNISMELSIL